MALHGLIWQAVASDGISLHDMSMAWQCIQIHLGYLHSEEAVTHPEETCKNCIQLQKLTGLHTWREGVEAFLSVGQEEVVTVSTSSSSNEKRSFFIRSA